MKLPSMQFYPGDWQKDPGIKALGFHDRGVWFEILLLMFESEDRGKLMLNGAPMPDSALACALGLDKQILTTTLTTLLTYGVASKCEDTGALMCRRMVRDEKIRKLRQNAGKQGGNPILLKQIPTPGVKQIPTPSSSSSASADIHIVEPPAGFPKTEQEAIASGAAAGVDPETCKLHWNIAAGRGWTDSKGQPIRSWPHHVKAQATMNAGAKAERAAKNGNVLPERPAKEGDGEFYRVGGRKIAKVLPKGWNISRAAVAFANGEIDWEPFE